MAEITSIETERGWAFVIIDGGETLRVRKSVFSRIAPMPRVHMDADEFLSLLAQAEKPAALDAALKYLTARARSASEIKSRLTTLGFRQEAAVFALERLAARGLVNDEQFARDWTSSRAGKAIGPTRLKRELLRKGIGADTFETAQGDCGGEYQSAANSLMAKLLIKYKYNDPIDRKRKASATLVRRGFTWEQAREAYKHAMADVSSFDFQEDF